MIALKLLHSNNLTLVGKKNYINPLVKNEPIEGVLFVDFILKTVDRKVKRKGETYRKNFQTLIFHLNHFSSLYDVDIFTNSVNEEFLDDFITYLEKKELKLNYIKNLLSLVKSMIKKAGQLGYAVDKTYDMVKIEGEVPFSVFLSIIEIARIYYFIGLTEKQERIKDLFVVGCMTGLRYSDYSTLTRNNFDGDFINKITKKTRTRVSIPISDFVNEIFEKYDGEISTGLSIQHFNRYIKHICKKIGLNQTIKFSYTKGGKIINETKEKWELISSHTARRSAATNMYLTGRMNTYEIMAITGHTTEKSFFKYIKITQENTVKRIAGDNFFRI